MREFYQAVKYGNLELVKLYVSNGVNYKENESKALRWAILFDHLEIIKYFIELGDNFRVKNNSPILIASLNDNFDVVKYLVILGADYKVICPTFNTNKLVESLYNEGHFNLAINIAIHCNYENNVILKSLKRIAENRKSFFQKLKSFADCEIII